MSIKIDEISPADIGEDKLVLQLADPSATIQIFIPFEICVNYDATEPEGVVLPLELVIRGPRPGQETRRKFTRSRPERLLVTPTTRGQHFVLLRELFHNRWQGRMTVEVIGEDLQTEAEDRT